MNFSVVKRNPGHFDIVNASGRLFRIRGTPGKFLAMDERERPYPVVEFKTLPTCMGYICDILMDELIVPEEPYVGNNKRYNPNDL